MYRMGHRKMAEEYLELAKMTHRERMEAMGHRKAAVYNTDALLSFAEIHALLAGLPREVSEEGEEEGKF